MIEQDLKNFQEAVNEAILNNHARGLPAYQIEKGYIVAIYPNGHKVQLEKVKGYQELKALWYSLR